MPKHLTIVNIKTGAFDVYAGRPGILGNRFSIGEYGTRDDVLDYYKFYAWRRAKRDPAFRAAILECKGKRVGCHCHPLPCHVAIIDDLITAIEEGKV